MNNYDWTVSNPDRLFGRSDRHYASAKFAHSWLLIFLISITPIFLSAQTGLSPRQIKKLSVEELMNIDVTLVSRVPEKLTEAASAIQVITNEDIRRSGATNVAEALRLAPNLQVAQLSASVWIISARGFNNIFSNKLLVMIDGRTVYTPLYGGVLWEQHNLLLEDVERIEVVSGPGGTLWGSNAVNGIINIVTRHSANTQGLFASLGGGTFIKRQTASLRYGGKLGEKGSYKIYGTYLNRGDTELPNGTPNTDGWEITQAGFRTDWNASKQDALTVQGDVYAGNRHTSPKKSDLNGQNILGRWSRTISDNSELRVQLYFDRYFRRDAPTISSDKMTTVDADLQHSFLVGSRHSLVWGVGYRYVQDDADFTLSGAGILPRKKRLDLYSGFVQDEIKLGKRVRLTVGTKILHNVYTGLEWQPSGRLAWVNKGTTLWGAITRAVRTPSRLDVDYYLPTTPQPPNIPSVAGGPNFVSEKLVAYELGYRFQPNAVSSFSISTFYNDYRDVYSVETMPGTVTYQIQNGSEAQSWGAEISANYQVHKRWRLRGGYTYFNKDIYAKPGRIFDPSYLGNDVRNQAMLQSMLDLPLRLQLDLVARHLDAISASFATQRVPAYFTFDARLAFTYKGLELALIGQNLTLKHHTEFGPFDIPRSLFAKISARF